jgi:hypothetical protein
MMRIFTKNGHAAQLADSIAAAPKIFTIFTDFWQLDGRMAKGFWQALTQAQWSRAVSLRQCLELFEGRAGSHHPSAVHHLMHEVCGPKEVIIVLEELHSEGLFTRRECTTLQDTILSSVGPTGGWGR